MADGTKIEWTEATWNPITGCSVVSPGCTNCYAMRLAGTRQKHHPSRAGLTKPSKAGPVWTGEVRFNEQWLDQPLRWRRPRMIFVAAHGDLFHEAVPDEWIDKVFAVMALAPQHTFQVLTKRPERMREYISHEDTPRRIARALLDMFIADKIPDGKRVITDKTWPLDDDAPDDDPSLMQWPLPNVWLGTSVEDQRSADERIPALLATPAAVRWISAEPLLGPVDLRKVRASETAWLDAVVGEWWSEFGGAVARSSARLDWVVVGGESAGPGARPMHPDWARDIRDQCAAAGVPFFFKQWGDWAPWDDDNWSLPDGADDDAALARVLRMDGAEFLRVGKKAAGRTLDKRKHNAMPGVRP